MAKCDIGVVGLAVMGQNLVLNIQDKGFRVAAYNRTAERTREFIAQRGASVTGTYSLEAFVEALERPRKILMLVKAGSAVDGVIERLVPHLEPGDIVIDGGNSHYSDTERRAAKLEQLGLEYVGMGVSGGEHGALHGPSLMPGGSRSAYDALEPIITKIAAQTDDGPCCTYLGPGSAGHFVKMVHNGIEYGIMQVLAEAYDLMKRGLGLDSEAMQRVVAGWNEGELASYLVEITVDILRRRDGDGSPLVEKILDQAGQKGTGKWTSQSALDFGIPVPTITAAVDARILSAFKSLRTDAAEMIAGPVRTATAERGPFLAALHDAVYLAVAATYAQGTHLLQAASQEKSYDLPLSEVARIWKGGCIIRAALLEPIKAAYERRPQLAHLFLDPFFAEQCKRAVEGLRQAGRAAVRWGVPAPSLHASLAYLDGLRSERLPANLIQAQRDYFGAHTYRRVDREGAHHTEWQAIHNV